MSSVLLGWEAHEDSGTPPATTTRPVLERRGSGSMASLTGSLRSWAPWSSGRRRSLGGSPAITRKASDRVQALRDELKTALQNHDRQHVRRAIRAAADAVTSLRLKPSKLVSREQAVVDLAREPLLALNEVRFADPTSFVESLELLTRTFVDRVFPSEPEPLRSMRTAEIAEALLARLARTFAGGDSYFALQGILGLDEDGESDFVLMPRHRRESWTKTTPEIELNIRASEGRLVASVKCRNAYGLHRMSDEDEDVSTFSARPSLRHSPAARTEWVALYTTISEEIDLMLPDAAAPVALERYLSISLDPPEGGDSRRSRPRSHFSREEPVPFRTPMTKGGRPM